MKALVAKVAHVLVASWTVLLLNRVEDIGGGDVELCKRRCVSLSVVVLAVAVSASRVLSVRSHGVESEELSKEGLTDEPVDGWRQRQHLGKGRVGFLFRLFIPRLPQSRAQWQTSFV